MLKGWGYRGWKGVVGWLVWPIGGGEGFVVGISGRLTRWVIVMVVEWWCVCVCEWGEGEGVVGSDSSTTVQGGGVWKYRCFNGVVG